MTTNQRKPYPTGTTRKARPNPRAARRGSRRTPILSPDGDKSKSKTIGQWAKELDIPYKTMYERYRVAAAEVRNTLGLGLRETVELPQAVVDYILRPARKKPGWHREVLEASTTNPDQCPDTHAPATQDAQDTAIEPDPLQNFSDVEVIWLRQEAARLGMPFKKIRALLRNPEFEAEIRAMIGGEDE
jgi:hypothetical protein